MGSELTESLQAFIKAVEADDAKEGSEDQQGNGCTHHCREEFPPHDLPMERVRQEQESPCYE
jgi:hypothetical protein